MAPHTANQTTNLGVRLNSQVALITGGGTGLGRAFAQTLARAGAKVAVLGRTQSALDETVALIAHEGGTALALSADVTDATRMAEVVAEVERDYGPVDILVNNAAVFTPVGNDWELEADDWWRSFEINVRGPYTAYRAVLPGMMARRRGRIINISSPAATMVAPYASAYCASKAALSHLTAQQSAAVKEYGISVFALSPSGATPMTDILTTSPNIPEPVREFYRQRLETGTEQTDQSSALLLFLVSGQADALSGRHIPFRATPDDLLQRADRIVENDLYVLRLRV